MELADAAGDELGELAPEVEDDDRVGLEPGTGRRASRSGGRGVERDLEVGLDLGVVRGEDPVTGVRRLAVDGLAALGGRRSWSPVCTPAGSAASVIRWCRS